MHIRAIHDRQDVNLVGPHPFQRQVKALIGVNMRKIEYVDNLPKLQVGILREFPFQRCTVDYSDYAAAIQHEPGLESAQVGTLQCFPNRNLAWQRLCQSAHDSDYLTLTLTLAGLRRWQVYAVLYCKGLVDGLQLKSRGNEKAHQISNHQRDDNRVVL